MFFESVLLWLEQHPYVYQIVTALGVVVLSFVAYLITRHYVIKTVSALIRRTKIKYDDILLQETLLRRLSYIAPLIIIHSFASQFPFADIVQKVTAALIAWFIVLSVGSFLTGFQDVYQTFEVSKGRSIKSYIQIVKLFLYIMGAIIIVGTLLGRSPMVLLSGFGAMTAVILLIFRDTILSFVASLQISSNDLVRVGDWIESPKFNADGDVVDIALHTVKVQNWDKTFTIIPTYKLIDESFKNWRGMQQSGGRRIKRAIHIDLSSIKFCDDEMIQRFKKIQFIADYVERKQDELRKYNEKNNIDDSVLVNGRRMTNIGTFRAYVEAYLHNHKKIHQNMTFLVRQLPSGPTGLPLEIYVFSNDTAWANYEAIQADIFDHILAVVPQFDLRVFQEPTGKDFGRLTAGDEPGAPQ